MVRCGKLDRREEGAHALPHSTPARGLMLCVDFSGEVLADHCRGDRASRNRRHFIKTSSARKGEIYEAARGARAAHDHRSRFGLKARRARLRAGHRLDRPSLRPRELEDGDPPHRQAQRQDDPHLGKRGHAPAPPGDARGERPPSRLGNVQAVEHEPTETPRTASTSP
jgi:hypothetical protein